MMEFVSWDDEIPNIWKIKFMFQTTNQVTSITVVNKLFIPWPKSPNFLQVNVSLTKTCPVLAVIF